MAVRGVFSNSQSWPPFRALASHLIYQRTACNVAKDSLNYCQLSKRGLLRIGGIDSVKLLQGLVTNNVELFHQDSSLRTMYSMVLNAQGRILYDTILYKDKGSSDSPCFLMECDKSALSSLSKLIKMYRLRSKVNITPIENIFPWVAFNPSDSRSSDLDAKQVSGVISCGRDPRTEGLGWRFLLAEGATPSGIVDDVNESEEDDYEIHRIKLGISEGVSEIQPGVALPFEYNLDYINGVSFQKGCYIGQELTARTHHTGVIRKRLMPFTFNPPESIIRLEHGSAIKTSAGKTSGKLCIVHGHYGLALMRLAMLTNDKQYVKDNQGQDVEICPYIPKWWPKNDQIYMHQPGT